MFFLTNFFLMSRVMSQPVFVSGQKNGVRVRYFSGWVRLGQKILTRFAMSTWNTIT